VAIPKHIRLQRSHPATGAPMLFLYEHEGFDSGFGIFTDGRPDIVVVWDSRDKWNYCDCSANYDGYSWRIPNLSKQKQKADEQLQHDARMRNVAHLDAILTNEEK